jgi:hypothetical protein
MPIRVAPHVLALVQVLRTVVEACQCAQAKRDIFKRSFLSEIGANADVAGVGFEVLLLKLATQRVAQNDFAQVGKWQNAYYGGVEGELATSPAEMNDFLQELRDAVSVKFADHNRPAEGTPWYDDISEDDKGPSRL